MIVAEVEELVTHPEAAASNPGDAGSSPALSPRIAGAVYDVDGVLQLGCLVCTATIPMKLAKNRSKTCSPECAKSLRYMRDRNNLVPQYLNEMRKGKVSPERVLVRLQQLKDAPVTRKLHCQVCRGRIPAAMVERMSVTCGQECRNELRRYRVQVVKAQKCPHCYHPSTPAEWEQFRQWRASRGPMQAFMQLPGRGNLAAKREKDLREALWAAVGALKGELAVILDCYSIVGLEGAQKRASLSPDGEALAVPLEKIIERAEPLLAPRKKLIDTNGAD